MKENYLPSCPCGSRASYATCCEPYHNGEQIAATAEILMRTRYTAYSLANIQYIQSTMCDAALKNFDADSASKWAQAAKWKRLKIIRSFPHVSDPQRYHVEFMAFYNWQGKLQKLHETSEFKLFSGKWFYVDGN